MVRACRVALGDPCLVWAQEGQLDINGKVVPADGCFYGWFGGLQLLCGDKEMQRRLEQGRYTRRPCGEQLLCDGIAFKISDPAPGTKEDALLEAKSINGRVAVVVPAHNFLPRGQL